MLHPNASSNGDQPKTQNSHQINQPFSLPPEILLHIVRLCASRWDCDFPSLRFLTSLRLVSKYWKPVVEEIVVQDATISDPTQKELFLSFVRNNGLGSFVKKCTISNRAIRGIGEFLPTFPKLRHLTVNNFHSTNATLLRWCVPSLQELTLGCCERPRGGFVHFNRLLPFISELASLKVLTLDSVHFGRDDHPLPFSLKVLRLLNCQERGRRTLSRVFVNSNRTLLQYVFISSNAALWTPGYPRSNHSLRDVIIWRCHLGGYNSQHLGSYDNQYPGSYDSEYPNPIHSVSTLNATPDVLLAFQSQANWIFPFSRLVLVSPSFPETFTFQERDGLWDALRWLELRYIPFQFMGQFENAFSPLGQFLRVLCLFRITGVPLDLATIFPNLEALQVSDASIYVPGLKAEWFSPSLRIFCNSAARSLQIKDVDAIEEALSVKQCSRLRRFICHQAWTESQNEQSIRLRDLLNAHKVDIIYIHQDSDSNAEEFNIWAQRIVLEE